MDLFDRFFPVDDPISLPPEGPPGPGPKWHIKGGDLEGWGNSSVVTEDPRPVGKHQRGPRAS